MDGLTLLTKNQNQITMENYSPRKRYNLISILTFLVILITFGYYYFYFVQHKENQFHSKAFRVIENLGENVKKKHKNYFSNVNKALLHITKYNGGINGYDEVSLKKRFTEFDVPEEIQIIEIQKGVSLKTAKTQEEIFDQVHEGEIGMKINVNFSDTTLFFKFKTSALFKNTLRKDFFKKFIVIEQQSTSGEGHATEYRLKLIHSDLPLIINHRVSHEKLDTTFFSSGALSSTRLININFQNNKHNLYLTPVDMGNGSTFYIGGIIEKEVFRRSTFGLGPLTFSIIIVILFLLILVLPFLKLRLISEDERLNTSDAIFSFMALVIGSAFIFLLMLSWQSREKRSTAYQRDILFNYTEHIEQNLKKEIEKSLTLLDRFDSIPKNTDTFPEFNSGSETISMTKFNYYATLRNRISSPEFKYDRQIINCKPKGKTAVFWTNKNGDQLIKWSTQTNTPRVNVGTRDYFKKVINNNLWNDASLSEHPFYMHAILSMTDGKYYMMFSKESNDSTSYTELPDKFKTDIQKNETDADLLKPEVVVLARNLSSLKNLPLPSNVSFMLTDHRGEVLYHQTESKILQENLLNETGFNKQLNSALQSHIDTLFTEDYDGIKQTFYIKPVGELPIFLVTYLNAEYERITDIQSLGLSSLLYSIFIFMLLIQIGIFVIINQNSQSKTAGKNLLFGWIWPDKQKYKIYKALSIYIMLSIVICFYFKLNSNIFILLSYFSLMAAFVIVILNWFENIGGLMKSPKNLYYLLAIIIFNIVLILDPLNSGLPKRVYIGYFLFLTITIVLLFLIKYLLQKKKDVTDTMIIKSYNLFIFVLILSLGLFPIISFYSKSYNLEKELYLRSMQLSLAKNMANISSQPSDLILANQLNEPIISISDTSRYIKFSPGYIKTTDSSNTLLTNSEYRLIKQLRYTYDTNMFNSGSIDFLQVDDTRPFNWNTHNDTSLLFDKKYVYKSTPMQFKILPADMTLKNNYAYVIFIFAGFIIFCFITVRLILYWSEKTFLLGLPHKKNKDEFEMVLKSFKFIYLISLPYSGVKKYLYHYDENAHIIPIREWDQFNFIKNHLNKIREKQPKNVILYDSDTFTERLIKAKTNLIAALINLMNEKDNSVKKLILVSNTHPSYKVNKFKKDKKEDSTILDQYMNILGNFKRVFFPFGFKPEKSEEDQKLYHLTLECMYEDTEAWENWKKNQLPENDKEAAMLNIQSLSQIQFFSIWNGLEIREQYLIYDLAQDGLVNYRNIKVVDNLIYKGILKYDNLQLKLFNDSFQNFVLTNIDKEESLRIERDAKRSGNWSNLQLPFIMVIFALFAFLFVTQQEIFNDIIAWLGTALISLPLLLRAVAGVTSFKQGVGKS